VAVLTHVEKANRYAKAVVSGKILACKWVRLACQRHLDDLKRAKTRAFPYKFDPDRAGRVCRFIELFPHVKGHWATPQPGKKGSELLKLEDWQCFYLCSVWGWVEKKSGHRRFRTAYLEVPRKNGKSILAGACGLFSFAADGEFGAEVYSGATTEKQAWEVFRPARLMADRSPDFQEHYGVEVNAKSLTIPANGSRFEPVIGKPGDGASPSHAIVDEYHEHPDPTMVDTMQTGMGARLQPLLQVITTAGDNLGGPCYAMHDDAIKTLERSSPEHVNETLFALIYTIDDGDDWTAEDSLRKANPNYGVSVGAAFLQQQQREAVSSAMKQGVFKTKHLNVWVAARSGYMNMEWWNRQADDTLTREQFKGERFFAGVDLASKIDLSSRCDLFVRTIDGEEHWYLFGRHYCPQAMIDEPQNRHYQAWQLEKWLTGTEGDETDQERIKLDLLEDAREYEVAEIAFDEWGAIKMAQELQSAGLTVIRVPQNVKHLSDPMKLLEAKAKAGTLHHNGDPILAWAMSNVTIKPDRNENIFPGKERPQNKIDPAVAAILAAGRASVHAGAVVAVDFIGDEEASDGFDQ
jgi:phage terminase large subunit-like protein